MYFMMKWSPSKGASVYKVSSNSEKILLQKKHQRGKPSKFFGSTKKKKNLFYKCCRACQQESAYKIIQGSGF